MPPNARRTARTLLALLAPLVLAGAPPVRGTEPSPGPRPRIGLVLSGGGARGAAHAGALKALEELRVPVDFIAGTSAGAVVGALYASGRSPDEIERILSETDWSDAFEDASPRRERPFRRKRDDEGFLLDTRIAVNRDVVSLPSGIVQGQQLLGVLQRELAASAHVQDFDDLVVPFRAIATDIIRGETVVLGTGSLAHAVRASSGVPGVFSPVRIDGRLLVDGGVTNNVPVDVARAMGADVLVVVDVTTPLAGEDGVLSVVGVISQLTSITTLANSRRQLEALSDGDVLLQPELGTITTMDFQRVPEAVAAGASAARAAAERLAPLALDAATHAAWIAKLRPAPAPPRIDTLMAVTDARLSVRAITARMRQRPGAPLDVKRIGRDVDRIHGLGLFETVSWRIEPAGSGRLEPAGSGRLEPAGSGRGLLVEASRLAAGSGYLQLGLALHSDAEGRNRFQVGAAYTRPMINAMGGEWRTEAQLGEDAIVRTELHQPLGSSARWFANPAGWVSRDVRDLFAGSERAIAEYRFSEGGLSLEAGRELGTWGEVRVGIRRARGESDLLLGDPSLPSGGYDRGAAVGRLALDLLDDIHFPGHGVQASLEWTASRPMFGADERFDRAELRALAAFPWGRRTRGTRGTIVASARLVRTLAGTLPAPDRVQLGGFLNLSGLREDQLDGQELGLVRLVYSQELGRSRLFPVHAGVSLEAGNAWEQSDEIAFDTVIPGGSLFLGYDSPVGPVYLGVGFAEGGRSAVYLHLGRAF